MFKSNFLRKLLQVKINIYSKKVEVIIFYLLNLPNFTNLSYKLFYV